MTEFEAYNLAQTYLKQEGSFSFPDNNGVLVEYCCNISEDDRREFKKIYFFDYDIIRTDKKDIEIPTFAGARGISVDKQTKKVNFMTFGEYNQLEREEELIDKTYQIFIEFQQEKKHLSFLKNTYHLTSPEILKISKLLQNKIVNKEEIVDFIYKLIRTIK